MFSGVGKENIADGLLPPALGKMQPPAETRKAKKSRSMSIGPTASSAPLKEDSGNRRKVGRIVIRRMFVERELIF